MKNNPVWDTDKAKELYRAILELKSVDECRKFFRDLCTPEEIASISDRWQMVLMLKEGRSQRTIASELNVSLATVTRVNKWLKKGMGGYRLVLKRQKKK